METLYNWLLLNTGNEGNYLTILNVQRQTDTDDSAIARLAVMARTGDFEIINLIIQSANGVKPTDELAGRTPKDSYHFATEDQAVAYLAEGQTSESSADTGSSGIAVFVLEPDDDSNGLTFPPE